MKLHENFKQHLSSDIAAARRAFTQAALADPAALRELEESTELWLDLPVDAISGALSQIHTLRQGDSAAHAFSIRQEQVHIGQAVERLYMDAINTWLDAECQDVDLRALEREENLPEPEDAA